MSSVKRGKLSPQASLLFEGILGTLHNAGARETIPQKIEMACLSKGGEAVGGILIF